MRASPKLLPETLRYFFRVRRVAVLLASGLLVAIAAQAGRPGYLVWAAALVGAVIAVEVSCRLILKRTATASPLLGVILLLDCGLFTLLLQQTGGPHNPLSIFYLIFVTLAAVLLGARWSWAIAAFTTLCFASLFWMNVSVPDHSHSSLPDPYQSHLYGMLIAYALVASTVAYLVSRLVRERSAAERGLAQVALFQERVLAFGSLAANAAHELNTPLSTISLVAHELSLSNNTCRDADFHGDLALLQREVERCRRPIRALLEATRALDEHHPKWFHVRAIVEAALTTVGCSADLSGLPRDLEVFVDPGSITRALGGLLRNATEAGGNLPVRVRGVEQHGALLIDIVDRGPGVPAEVLERIGTPFVTTKRGRGGFGLGIYTAYLTSQQYGGSLSYFREGDATVCRLHLVLPLRYVAVVKGTRA
ncbi:MAG: HAMP domain-containing histidine kinase, partial [Bdellovibrionales bacterium]|nr:HAMP domain-containing histidine kinase [Bdellovibrionales bacterium]